MREEDIMGVVESPPEPRIRNPESPLAKRIQEQSNGSKRR